MFVVDLYYEYNHNGFNFIATDGFKDGILFQTRRNIFYGYNYSYRYWILKPGAI